MATAGLEDLLAPPRELADLEAQLLADGKSQAYIEAFMYDLRLLGLAAANQEMRDQGMTYRAIATAWRDLNALREQGAVNHREWLQYGVRSRHYVGLDASGG